MSGVLDARTARLVRLFAATIAFVPEELERLRREAPPGEPDRAWREVLLMAHLFCGFPRTLSTLEVLERAGGLGEVVPDEVLDELAPRERGLALFDRIYEGGSDAVRATLRGYHADLESWILGHAYGRVLSRPGLDAATRELCAVAALALQGHDRQLASHARGAVRCGASRADVVATLALVEDLVPPDFRDRAHSVIDRFAR